MSVLTVEEILDTYDLSDRVRKRILGIVNERQNSFSYAGSEGVYRAITNLVEQFGLPREERVATRLELNPHLNVSLTQGEPAAEEITERRFNPKKLFDILTPNFDPESLQEAFALLSTEYGFGIEDPKTTKERLEELASSFFHKGKVVIPAREIKNLSKNPLQVTYRRRRYHRNPLFTFEENKERYQGLSRSGLKRVDSGLHRALCDYGQIDLAIPQVITSADVSGLSEAEVDRIVFLHDTLGSARAVERVTKHAHSTVIKHLRLRGKEVRKSRDNGTQLSQEEIEKVQRLYRELGSTRAVREVTGYSANTIIKYARSDGQTIKHEGYRVISDEKRAQIASRILTTSKNNNQIARELGTTKETVKRIRAKLANPTT